MSPIYFQAISRLEDICNRGHYLRRCVGHYRRIESFPRSLEDSFHGRDFSPRFLFRWSLSRTGCGILSRQYQHRSMRTGKACFKSSNVHQTIRNCFKTTSLLFR